MLPASTGAAEANGSAHTPARSAASAPDTSRPASASAAPNTPAAASAAQQTPTAAAGQQPPQLGLRAPALLPQHAGERRPLSLRHLIATLERDPMYAKSTLLYKLYEKLD